jgi:hypothetical protein
MMGPEELGDLIDRHAAALTLYARQWCAAPEDVVQEAFIKLAGLARVPATPAAWLHRVVRNGAISAGRAEQRRAHRGCTTYLMPVGMNTMLVDNAQGLAVRDGTIARDEKVKGLRFNDVPDGLSNTLLVADVVDQRAVPWTRPEDWVPDLADPRKGFVGSAPHGGFQAAFADGSVRFLPATIDPKTLRALLTRNGGEAIPPY